MKKILIFCLICFAIFIVAGSFKDVKSLNQGFKLYAKDETFGFQGKYKKALRRIGKAAQLQQAGYNYLGQAASGEQCAAMAGEAGYGEAGYDVDTKGCYGK